MNFTDANLFISNEEIEEQIELEKSIGTYQLYPNKEKLISEIYRVAKAISLEFARRFDYNLISINPNIEDTITFILKEIDNHNGIKGRSQRSSSLG